MMTFFTGFYAFVIENWLALAAGAALVGGWLFICHEICTAAEPERDADAREAWSRGGARWTPSRSSRLVLLSSQREAHHAHPHASFRTRRS